MNKKSIGDTIFSVINYSLILIISVCTLYPLIYVLFASISSPSKLISHQGLLLHPLGFSSAAFKMVFRNPMIIRGYLNTIFYTITATTLNLLLTSLTAYSLSRPNVYFNKAILIFITFTMFFSGGLIPLFLVVKDLGLTNTRASLILPGALSVYNLIIMRTSFQAIPESFIESAKIEGANDLKILISVVLPLSVPVIVVILLFYGVHHWNAWFHSMLFINKRILYPLQIILREILIESSNEALTSGDSLDVEPVGQTIKYAAIVVSTIPILCVYPFLQKHFVKGVMIGGIKG